jgi:hypothetical protein
VEIFQKITETEMGNRGTKSDFKNKFVKAQRVDGNYFDLPSKLRCTLMGFERNYQIKIPSKLLSVRSYSTSSNNSNSYISP